MTTPIIVNNNDIIYKEGNAGNLGKLGNLGNFGSDGNPLFFFSSFLN